MAVEAGANSDLVQVVALLAAGVIAVPIFKKLGLGSVLGYLAAGVVIGPFVFGLFTDAQSIIHVAELGVVMFLFIIGLEMQPSRLWSLRRQIFGLGVAQVLVCGILLTFVGVAAGFPVAASFIAGMGFTLSSTAIVMQLLEERGETATPDGQRAVSILLLEDLAIVPLLALVALLDTTGEVTTASDRWQAVGIAIGSLGLLVAAGLWLLNPLFRLLAAVQAREVMTAAALLVVLGAALAMQLGGLSMAMGAFLAGVLLSESTFRHQLEADIEPFRGILLGLFFLGVGMSLDFRVIAAQWPLILGAVISYMLVKGIGIYLVARLTHSDNRSAFHRVGLFAQGGEFAFVLFSAATAAQIFSVETNAVMTATVILSMALTPLLLIAIERITPAREQSLEGVDVADGLDGKVLIIGFGRFGQIVSQPLLLRGVDVTIIDNDVEMIQAASNFGFKVYYGDGTRTDMLHAAGAGNAEAVLICVNDGDIALRIARNMREEFPLIPVLARAYDRGTAIQLIGEGVEYQLRETFESALLFGRATLDELDIPEEEADEIIEEVRRRDTARLEAQIAGGLQAGRGFMKGNMPVPTPLTQPRHKGRAMNAETADKLRPTEQAASS
ncbi:monovalent cation:proton antiporter-2 (CPA2) family protein [Mesorhizobium sp. RP14(2022)]|uniref:Monovalent cation:proton antiporter-2 (CPA2) family protein n=1 Tax=Mesorhizobium liriopis TaxID=2953882 RepID=A0ABT1CBA3_9HYPH|nr:monovalent cation:proton antiporter-2 (CPA2) family protein [Mesorhizobium liriopis]MCO6052090.1 monovalent cation:proton antiporter-2 (CPA2) family protein [Mesorhizobium liriopis]